MMHELQLIERHSQSDYDIIVVAHQNTIHNTWIVGLNFVQISEKVLFMQQ